MAGDEIKTIGDVTVSTLQGNGFTDSGNVDLRDEVRSDRSSGFLGAIKSKLVSSEATVGVNVKTTNDEFTLAGTKTGGDQADVTLTHIKYKDGSIEKLGAPITVSFDKENNPQEDMVKGAVRTEDVHKLNDTFQFAKGKENGVFLPKTLNDVVEMVRDEGHMLPDDVKEQAKQSMQQKGGGSTVPLATKGSAKEVSR